MRYSYLVAVSLTLAFAQCAGAADKCVITPPKQPAVRPNFNSLSSAKVAALERGVSEMQKRDSTNPTSWSYQAAMHGTTRTPAMPEWNTCQHGSYFFLSWHRMYLYFFERILRGASGDPSLELPYWAYDPNNEESRRLPAPFRDTKSVLYVAQRKSAINGGSAIPASTADSGNALRYLDYTCNKPEDYALSFGGRKQVPSHFTNGYGRLESAPHNGVHVEVGGWMSDPNTAAQDPIFWLHHANIDRLWNAWFQSGEANLNIQDDTTWRTTEFTFFDENGKACSLTGEDIVNSAGQLGYVYEDESYHASGAPIRCPENRPTAAASRSRQRYTPAPQRKSLATLTETVQLGDKPTVVQVPSTISNKQLGKQMGGSSAIVLTLSGFKVTRDPEIGWEIYINLPSGETPNFQNGFYAGSVYLFDLEDVHRSQDRQLEFDITDLVASLHSEGLWTKELTLTFVPKDLDGVSPHAVSKVSFDGITISLE